MHDKLSQAVKLYDQILSQQVAQPRWRTSSLAPVSPGPYQQPQQSLAYGQAYAPNGYAQWAPQGGYQAPVEAQREPLSPRISYASPPPLQEQQYQQLQQHTQQHTQQPQYAPSHVSIPTAPQISPSIPSATLQSPQYAQQQPQYTTPLSAPVPPLQSQYQPVSFTPTPSTSSSTPLVSLPHSPPPIEQRHYQPPTPQTPSLQSSNLTRHSSAYYVPSQPAAPIASLTRSSTVSSHAPPQLHRPQQQQQQQFQAPSQPQPPQSYQISSPPPAVVSLSQFPSAPTSAPQPTFSVYGSPIPSGFEHKEERKEALLIDL